MTDRLLAIKNDIIRSRDIGDLYFGQLNVKHQDFFDALYSQHTRIKVRHMPHYIFWRDGEYKSPEKSLYMNYLKHSWEYYYPKDNTEKRRMTKIRNYTALMQDIEKQGVQVPTKIVTAPDGARIIVSGHHRASIAYHLNMDLPYAPVSINNFILKATRNKSEFYGTKRSGIPYQSIFYKDEELLEGRRRDVLRRFLKMDLRDIRGKTVLDVGSNIAINAMLAYHYGAKSVTAAEFSPKIGSSALRLSTLFGAEITMLSQDLGALIKKPPVYDTVFCFSLYAHVNSKENLEKNLAALTGRTLYFEGHQRTSEAEYQHVFRHFKTVELLGHNEDGVHSKAVTRPFFRCSK
jgi:hypothetical protein